MLKNPSNKISKGSLKSVRLICDYCKCEFDRPQRTRYNSYKKFPTDACDECRSIRRKETCLKKYGVEVASQNKEVRKKASVTKGGDGKLVEDYRDEIIRLYNESDNVSINSISKKLGITRSVLIDFCKSLGLETTGDIQEKAKRTTKEKYGEEHFLQTDAGQQKMKKTMLEKYGYENPYDNEQYKNKVVNKSKSTNLERYGYEMPLNNPNKQEELNEKRKNTRIKNGHQIEWEGKNAKDICKDIGINLSSFHERVRKIGIEKAISKEKRESSLEIIFEEWLKTLDIEYEKQFVVDKKIADFKIGNIIIECDGLYWHSDVNKQDKKYHQEKRETYIKNGYTPLFFREDEIHNKLPVIQSIILNKLDRQENRIFARKCEISSCPKGFFIENHLMGKGYGKIFSLKHNGTDVAAIQIRRLRNKDYEISRFCTALHTSVVGGFSKLLKHVERNIEMDSLKTFIDLRYGKGDYLADFGFTEGKEHLSFKWTNGIDSIHRLKYRGNSGYDLGFYKIWDCGQLPFTKLY